jgi:hypothetical protein
MVDVWIDYDDGHAGGFPHPCTRPARAGDVVEVPCPWQMDWVNMGTDCGKGCAKCDGKQVVNVRLTEDPRAEMWMTATPTIGGWLIVGTIEP